MGPTSRLLLLLFMPVILLGMQPARGPLLLTFWEHENDSVQKALDNVIADFESEYPGIKIRRSHFKTEDLRTQYQTAALGRGGGDIVLAPNDFGGPFSLMGIIQPVSAWGRLERFDDGLVASVKDAQGNAWGLPVSRGNHLMFYVNSRIYPKAPETIEELVHMAKKVTDPSQNRYGFAYFLNEPYWLTSFVGAFGTYPLSGDKPTIDTPGMVDALTLVRKFKFDDKIVPSDCDYTCADTLFIEGKVGAVINGDWELQRYSKALGADLKVLPLPRLEATGRYLTPPTSGKFLFFNENLHKERLEAAKIFAEYMVRPKVQEKLVATTGRLPSLKELAASPVVLQDPLLKASAAALAHGIPTPMNVEMRVVWDAMRPQLQGVMAGRVEPAAAVTLMQKDAVTKIKDLRE